MGSSCSTCDKLAKDVALQAMQIEDLKNVFTNSTSQIEALNKREDALTKELEAFAKHFKAVTPEAISINTTETSTTAVPAITEPTTMAIEPSTTVPTTIAETSATNAETSESTSATTPSTTTSFTTTATANPPSLDDTSAGTNTDGGADTTDGNKRKRRSVHTKYYKQTGSMFQLMVNHHRNQMMNHKRINPAINPNDPISFDPLGVTNATVESLGQIA